MMSIIDYFESNGVDRDSIQGMVYIGHFLSARAKELWTAARKRNDKLGKFLPELR